MLSAIRIRSSLLTAVCVAFLGGCAGMPDVKEGEIILDSKRHLLCYSTSYDCYDLSLIIANFERDRILRLHGLDPWDWSQLDSVTEFVELLIRPKGGEQAEKTSKFIYRLPANERNMEAWSVLYDEYIMRSHSH
ncbi:MAG: hypothetical protein V7739_12790 [Motiliproteus sp.]